MIINPLRHVPLNTKRSFVMGKTPKGCEVYMPVDSFEDKVLQAKKIELQVYLNSKTVLLEDVLA